MWIMQVLLFFKWLLINSYVSLYSYSWYSVLHANIVWQMNRSAKRLLIVTTDLDGFM